VARKRGTETVGDMVRSMLVVLIPVAFVAGLVGLLRPSDPEVRDVAWQPALESAREGAGFTALGPSQVPAGWTVTRVALEPDPPSSTGVWRMNLVTDAGEYIGLVQRTGDVAGVARSEIPGYVAEEASLVAGATWQQYVEEGADEPDHALVRDTGDSVVVVLTSASDYSLAESFAASLR
jgi:hypothetical protein